MKLSEFSYNLPEKLIAQKPQTPRDHCRLLVVDKNKSDFKHLKFFNIEQFLEKGDVVILNDSKVIPARIHAKKETGGSVEILLIRKISTNSWEAMIKNFKTKELGKEIFISKNFVALPTEHIEAGLWKIRFNLSGRKLDEAIRKTGETPLPPYIKKQAKLKDYQTIYAKNEGSVASPTAGLHFTEKLIKKLQKKGVIFKKVTLHVGLGTFSPIREEAIEKHKMHFESASVSKDTAQAINKAKKEKRRVIAVGTTSIRTLEGFAYDGKISSGKKEINLFITPGYEFQIVDAVITNFHLPDTTLLILVAAFAGKEKILNAYQEAVNKKYKFFSFGDAMLII